MRRIACLPEAYQDSLLWSREHTKIHRKIVELLHDIERDPFSGLRKPEPLKHELKGLWSRRITREHRLGSGLVLPQQHAGHGPLLTGGGGVVPLSFGGALDRQRRTPRWFALPGLVAAVGLVAFLAMPPAAQGSQDVAQTLSRGRPTLWWPALAEWLVVAGGLGWVVLAARIKEP